MKKDLRSTRAALCVQEQSGGKHWDVAFVSCGTTISACAEEIKHEEIDVCDNSSFSVRFLSEKPYNLYCLHIGNKKLTTFVDEALERFDLVQQGYKWPVAAKARNDGLVSYMYDGVREALQHIHRAPIREVVGP